MAGSGRFADIGFYPLERSIIRDLNSPGFFVRQFLKNSNDIICWFAKRTNQRRYPKWTGYCQVGQFEILGISCKIGLFYFYFT